MSDVIPPKARGAAHFFTVRLRDPSSDLLLREVARLRQATRMTRARYPFDIDAIVVLPGTVHTLWSVPADDNDISHRWTLLKSLFSRGLPSAANRTPAQALRGDKAIWQRRIWHHVIRDSDDLERHRRMIHAAPVQAGLVARPQDWLFTSLHRDLALRHRADTPAAPPPFSRMRNKTVASRPAATSPAQ